MKVNDASQSQRMVWTPDNFVLSEVSKGDFVGHPFRGNQWTDSSGISTTSGRITQQPKSSISNTYGGSFAAEQNKETGKYVVDEEGMNNFIVRQHSDLELTESEKTSINRWQSYDYAKINAVMRGESKLESLNEDERQIIGTTITNLNKILSEATLDEDVIVFRGVSDEEYMFDDPQEGSVIKDAGFTATTLNPTFAVGAALGFIESDQESSNPIVFRILVPKGTPAFAAAKLSGETNDPDGDFMKPDLELLSDVGSTHAAEIVLPPNTKFRIGDEDYINGQRIIELEVIPDA